MVVLPVRIAVLKIVMAKTLIANEKTTRIQKKTRCHRGRSRLGCWSSSSSSSSLLLLKLRLAQPSDEEEALSSLSLLLRLLRPVVQESIDVLRVVVEPFL